MPVQCSYWHQSYVYWLWLIMIDYYWLWLSIIECDLFLAFGGSFFSSGENLACGVLECGGILFFLASVVHCAVCSVVELECGGHQWSHPAADSFPDTRNPLRSLNRSPNGARGVWIVLFRVDLTEMGLISMRGINSGASLSQRVIDAKRLSKMGCKT